MVEVDVIRSAEWFRARPVSHRRTGTLVAHLDDLDPIRVGSDSVFMVLMKLFIADSYISETEYRGRGSFVKAEVLFRKERASLSTKAFSIYTRIDFLYILKPSRAGL
jgi:hypothetical protein